MMRCTVTWGSMPASYKMDQGLNLSNWIQSNLPAELGSDKEHNVPDKWFLRTGKTDCNRVAAVKKWAGRFGGIVIPLVSAAAVVVAVVVVAVVAVPVVALVVEVDLAVVVGIGDKVLA